MASYRLSINPQLLQTHVQSAIGKSPTVKKAVDDFFKAFYAPIRRNTIRAFDRHLVTKEIEAGPEAENESRTLDGYGNLFSYIGFEAGSRPTEELRQVLLDGLYYRQTQYRNGSWRFIVMAPTREEIASASQMPWERGNSWAYGIEQGMSNLSNYVYKHWEGPGSMSKEGFQLPYEYTDTKFITKPYISKILNYYRDKVNGTERS